MVRRRDVCFVDCSPYLEPKLVQSFMQRKIYTCADHTGTHQYRYAFFHAGVDDKWSDSVKRGFCFSVDFGRCGVCSLPACGFCLLGICADGFSSWLALILGIVRNVVGIVPSKPMCFLLRMAAVFIAGYGVYALGKNQILSYLFLTTQFVFFDFEKPVWLFFAEYMAIMGLFVFLAYYLSKGFKSRTKESVKSGRTL